MDYSIIIRLILSLVLSGVIGWNREQKGRPAGLRTHILVGIGATTVMIVSLAVYEYFPGSDAGRIAAQVVSGIGFLGAGTIITHGYSVKGLTTAASLWATAALGLAVGLGFYQLSIIAAAIIFNALYFLSDIKYGIHKMATRRVFIKGDVTNLESEDIKKLFQEEDMTAEMINFKRDDQKDKVELIYRIKGEEEALNRGLEKLIELEEIREMKWKQEEQ